MLKEIISLLDELKKAHTRSERVQLVNQVKKEVRELFKGLKR